MSILLFLSFLLLSCKKEAPPFLEYPEFKDIVGKWESISGELKSIEIDPKGRVSTAIDTERGEKFQMNEFDFTDNQMINNKDTIPGLYCMNWNGKKYLGFVILYKKPFSDTAICYIGHNIENGVLSAYDEPPLFVRVK